MVISAEKIIRFVCISCTEILFEICQICVSGTNHRTREKCLPSLKLNQKLVLKNAEVLVKVKEETMIAEI